MELKRYAASSKCVALAAHPRTPQRSSHLPIFRSSCSLDLPIFPFSKWRNVGVGAVDAREWNRKARETRRFEDGTEVVIGALIEVHRALGPGLLESAYEACLCAELGLRGLRFSRQVTLPIDYKGLELDCRYRLDLIVEERILVELKTVERLLPIHEAQVVTYLRLASLPVGLLVNFNVIVLKTGLRRLTPHYP
jgi:GxxExxY protein